MKINTKINLEDIKNKIVLHNADLKIPKKLHNMFIRKIENFSLGMGGKNQSHNYWKENRCAVTPKADDSIGKYGELASCFYLRNQGFPKIMPDFDIRTGINKKWVCDLPFYANNNNFPNCHVKTCYIKTLEIVKEFSWTFQLSNETYGGGRDILFDYPKSKEIIVFVFVPDLKSRYAKIVATSPWFLLQDIMADPILYYLKGKKKCIYYHDILKKVFEQIKF